MCTFWSLFGVFLSLSFPTACSSLVWVEVVPGQSQSQRCSGTGVELQIEFPSSGGRKRDAQRLLRDSENSSI